MPSATNSEGWIKPATPVTTGQKEKRLNMAEGYFEEIKTTVLEQATDKTWGMSSA